LSVSRALLSVSDKTGLVELARGLVELGIEILSTGGTARTLTSAGIPVTPVEDVTGFPEMMDGRVKTLHPAIHGGILANRAVPEHMSAIARAGIKPIDLVVVNLYPFEQTVADPSVTLETAVENIDIGGPAMTRAAAKNFQSVAVVVDPADYPEVLTALRAPERSVPLELRRRLATKAFAHTSAYDAAIASWLRGTEDLFPESLTIPLKLVQPMRYGENPHQKGAFYRHAGYAGPTLADATLLSGLEISYNNIQDADAALRVVMSFKDIACAIIKHTNPCGCALGADPVQAFRRAKEGDPVSAFGGIVAFNRPVTDAVAEALCEKYQKWDIIVAPSFDEDALERITTRKSWGNTVRLIAVPGMESGESTAYVTGAALDFKRVLGGMLAQEPDRRVLAPEDLKVVSKAQPTPEQMEQMLFAWTIMRHVKSNAIVLCKDFQLLGAGAGQMNRVNSVHLALRQAGDKAEGCVLASDAFFPFPDGPEMAIQGGVKAIIEPGGSTKDAEVIAVCDQYGIPLVFTGVRHFKH